MSWYCSILLLFISASSSSHAAECVYAPKPSKDNPYPELSPQGECGRLVNHDTFVLNREHFDNLYFSEHGLASIRYEGLIFYVSRTGKITRTHYFDNGADYFVEGVARTISSKKFGYIDRQLNVVIKPEYDFAFPFKNGVAIVCNGCRPEPDGEHKRVVGGKWGAINKSGQVVVPLK